MKGILATENLRGVDVFCFVSCWLHIPLPGDFPNLFEIITFDSVVFLHLVLKPAVASLSDLAGARGLRTTGWQPLV